MYEWFKYKVTIRTEQCHLWHWPDTCVVETRFEVNSDLARNRDTDSTLVFWTMDYSPIEQEALMKGLTIAYIGFYINIYQWATLLFHGSYFVAVTTNVS